MAPRSVLLAIDGSATMPRALERGIALAVEHRAVLTILAVEPVPIAWQAGAVAFPLGAPCAPDPSSVDPAGSSADRLIRQVLQHVPKDVSVRTICGVGGLRAVLKRQLEIGDFDTLVIGCSARGWFRHRLWSRVKKALAEVDEFVE